MKITATQLRKIIQEEVSRALREGAALGDPGRYAQVLADYVALVGTRSVGKLKAALKRVVDVYADAVNEVVTDDDATEAEMKVVLGAAKAAGWTRSGLVSLRAALQARTDLDAFERRDFEYGLNHDIEDDRQATLRAEREAAFRAVVQRLVSDRGFLDSIVPLYNKKLTATRSADKTAASKAVTAAIEAEMTPDELETTNPIEVHNEIQKRLLAVSRR